MINNLPQLLVDFGLGHSSDQPSLVLTAFACLLLSSFLLYKLAKGYILPLVRQLLGRFKPQLAGSIEVPLVKLSDRLAWLIPTLFCLAAVDWFIQPQQALMALIYKCLFVYLYINLALVFNALLSIGGIVYNLQTYAKEVPIKGIIQIVKLAVFIVFAVLVVAELMDKTAFYILSALGALTAVLLLVFKDTILGLVAGIQIASHRLVAHGDWIEMPQYGADGDVMEVGLHTVKVRNFDKTITTIPTYKLISDSFKNWRGMSQADGRRIKRAIYLDMGDIAFIDAAKIASICEQLDNPAFKDFNQSQALVETNIGFYRQYCEFYLSAHQQINQQMTLMARQLAPNENGIAIELYCFCLNKDWVPYEKIQAQIVEHLLAQSTVFGLHPFQRPTGEDFQALRH